ncbi:uncharacterized protein LOC106866519 [Brachypodium distachyon]|uniref:uncharacterized protein LOC106866519 n=1 Tax=Brachypodium distachyon TaxID=15368 RepID=UPI00071CA73B|nr:uncharacterized protein LOC106866519 [Brachypodium distachyon]|eukprot:XP_014756365.1 uncharacterized protein LOC106866519 [Brachypodium distachyon]
MGFLRGPKGTLARNGHDITKPNRQRGLFPSKKKKDREASSPGLCFRRSIAISPDKPESASFSAASLLQPKRGPATVFPMQCLQRPWRATAPHAAVSAALRLFGGMPTQANSRVALLRAANARTSVVSAPRESFHVDSTWKDYSEKAIYSSKSCSHGLLQCVRFTNCLLQEKRCFQENKESLKIFATIRWAK